MLMLVMNVKREEIRGSGKEEGEIKSRKREKPPRVGGMQG